MHKSVCVCQILSSRQVYRKYTIYHGLLFMKLDRYGIRGLVYSWLWSYLEDRYQYICINSKLLKVNCGVTQGSVLGPKLFVMYISDIL